MKKLLAGIAFFLSILAGAQQYVDVLSLGYTTTPETGYDAVDGTTRIRQANLELFVPVPLNTRTALITGLSGNLDRLRPDPADETLGLYSAAAILGLNFTYENGWSSRHILRPQLVSSLQFGRQQLQLGSLQMLQKELSPNKSMGFGVFLNAEEYGLLFVPILSFYYLHPQDLWEVSAFLPARGDVNRRLSRSLRLGLHFDGLGSSYPINLEPYGEAYVQRASNDLSLYLQYRLTPSLIFSLKGGYSLFRSYRIYDKSDQVGFSMLNIYFNDQRNILNETVKDGVHFGLRCIYRFHLPAGNQE